MLTIWTKNDCMAGFIFVLIILVDAFQFKFKFKIVDYNATHNKDKIQHLCLFILKFCSIIANQIVISCPFIVNRLGSYSFSILYHIVIKKMYSLMHETVVLCQGRIFLMAIGVWVFTENTL